MSVTLQVLIGLGLIYRPTVKAALLTSFGWALSVWWMGEGLGGLFTGHSSPLTGAPGAALLYAFAGLIAWPRDEPQSRTTAAGGILGERGALVAWALLWLGSSALWLLPANRSDMSGHDAIASAPSGAHWLTSVNRPPPRPPRDADWRSRSAPPARIRRSEESATGGLTLPLCGPRRLHRRPAAPDAARARPVVIAPARPRLLRVRERNAAGRWA